MESLNADENAASGEGIEANDLAGLLTRFEEATNAVDDIAIPSASHKSKRSILLKAKSAGNSPAVTPPATPPPLGPRQNVCFKPQMAKRQKSLLPNPQTHKPIQFRLVVPPSVVQTKVTVASAVAANPKMLSSQIPTQSTALIVTPKVILQNTQAANFTVHKPQTAQAVGAKQLHIPASPTMLIKPGPLQAASNLTSLPLLLKPVPAVPPQLPKTKVDPATRIVSTAEVIGKTILIPASAPSALSSHTGQNALKTVNVLSMPIIDAGTPPVAKKISRAQPIPIPKSATPSMKTKVVKLPGSSKSKVVNISAPPVASPAPSPVPQSSKVPTKVGDSTAGGTPLLQSMLLNHCTSLMSSKLTSTSILSKNKLPLAPRTSLEAKMRLSEGIVNVTPTQGPSAVGKETASSKSNAGTALMLPSSKAVKASHVDKNSATVQRRTSVQTNSQSDILPLTSMSDGSEEKNSVGEHAYCSSATSGRLPIKSNSDISNSVSSIEMSTDVTATRGSDVDSGFVSSLESEIGSENSLEMLPGSSESVNEFVFEEGEIQVDDDGNDALDPIICSSAVAESTSSDDSSFRAVSFGRRRPPYSGQRGRQYRRRAELSNSPIREDTSNFFDKIPSHYTVLSIPTKPTKTTAFESATKAIGSTDHLELLNIPEVSVDDGHYDKVPSHRSIFTNTTKDLNVQSDEDEEDMAQSTEKEEEQSSRLHRSSSQRSRRSRSSHRSCRSGSRNSSRGRSLHSGSRSPDRRRWRSRSRSWRRRRSSSRFSSCSSMSSSSSVSYCSTCGGSLSRSRSRSYSSNNRSVSRSRSRSRSMSPGRERDRQMRRRRRLRLRSFSPRDRGFRSRSRSFSHSRSRSRSYSPERLRAQARRYGRSQRHRTKSRSSHERKLMERRKEREEEKIKAMEERRVVYVGKIPEGYTKFQLRKRFERFGDIKAVKINFREHGDNYGFVTFNYACDAIAAKEKGNNIPGEQRFDLCFGGRRHFCPDQYADLDGNREIEEEYAPMPKRMTEEFDYAALLKQHQSQQRKKR